MNSVNKLLTNTNSAFEWQTSFAIVIAIAIVISLSGIAIHPLESHEAYVLVSAQAMHDHQDWVVPWFNGEYRLNKPPMNYWLTAFVAWLFGGIDDIQPWHARFVSAFAGISLVGLTMLSGKKMFDSATGLLAGLMLATSVGFFYYTHTARPEMLYAFFCGAALTAYVYARCAVNGSTTQQVYSLLIWVAFGLATLTKGPQLPLMILLAFIVDCRLGHLTLKQSLMLLKPFSGLLILLAIVLPWWYLLQQRISPIELAHSQLSGSLLKPDMFNAFSAYYLYRPFQLILPWFFAIPFLAYWYKKNGEKIQKNNYIFLLILIILIPALILGFGPQKRWYYMLPSLIAMFLLLSVVLVAFFRANLNNKYKIRYSIALLIAVPSVFIIAVNTPYVISKDRMAEQNMAITAYAQVKAGKQLMALDVAPETFVYFTKRKVLEFYEMPKLLSEVARVSPQRVTLLIKSDRIKSLPEDIKYVVLEQIKREDESISLLQLN